MCKAMEERIERERIENLFQLVKNLMKNTQWSVNQAMKALDVSEEDKERLLKRF